VEEALLKKIGVILIVLSFVLYGLILLVPFMPLTGGSRTGAVGTLVIAGEASFWIGGIILGKEVVVKYRKKLNPLNWFRSKATAPEAASSEKITKNREQ
jgi:hypothetical protein